MMIEKFICMSCLLLLQNVYASCDGNYIMEQCELLDDHFNSIKVDLKDTNINKNQRAFIDYMFKVVNDIAPIMSDPENIVVEFINSELFKDYVNDFSPKYIRIYNHNSNYFKYIKTNVFEFAFLYFDKFTENISNTNYVKGKITLAKPNNINNFTKKNLDNKINPQLLRLNVKGQKKNTKGSLDIIKEEQGMETTGIQNNYVEESSGSTQENTFENSSKNNSLINNDKQKDPSLNKNEKPINLLQNSQILYENKNCNLESSTLEQYKLSNNENYIFNNGLKNGNRLQYPMGIKESENLYYKKIQERTEKNNYYDKYRSKKSEGKNKKFNSVTQGRKMVSVKHLIPEIYTISIKRNESIEYYISLLDILIKSIKKFNNDIINGCYDSDNLNIKTIINNQDNYSNIEKVSNSKTTSNDFSNTKTIISNKKLECNNYATQKNLKKLFLKIFCEIVKQMCNSNDVLGKGLNPIVEEFVKNFHNINCSNNDELDKYLNNFKKEIIKNKNKLIKNSLKNCIIV